jgi:hypothetical protein
VSTRRVEAEEIEEVEKGEVSDRKVSSDSKLSEKGIAKRSSIFCEMIAVSKGRNIPVDDFPPFAVLTNDSSILKVGAAGFEGKLNILSITTNTLEDRLRQYVL